MNTQDALSEKLDRLGEQWAGIPPEDRAARQAVENNIFLLAYQLFRKKKEQDAIGEVFLQDWREPDPEKGEKFDLGKGKLSSYLKRRVAFRAEDLKRQDQGWHRLTETDEQTGEKRRAWKNLKAEDPEGAEGTPLLDRQPARGWSDPEEALVLDTGACALLAAMLELPQRLEGRANNPARRNYFRLFFTDEVVNLIHSQDVVGALSRRERDLFQAIKESFLDFLMARVCRTAAEIQATSLKPYGCLVEGQPMDQEPPYNDHLPLDVYRTYLAQVEGRRVGNSAVSNQFAEYKEFVQQVLA